MTSNEARGLHDLSVSRRRRRETPFLVEVAG
jgi:hypothetical protein